MALEATVTKKSVSKVMDKMWHVTMNMVLEDDSVEVFNKDYSARFRLGDSVADKVAEFVCMMQADIDQYKGEQVIFNSGPLDSAVMSIQAGLEV